MLRIIGQLGKWFIICVIGYILLYLNWITFVAFVVLIVWRGNVKRRKQYESNVKESAEFVNEHSEEFEVMDVTGVNEDGKNRQDIIVRCYRGDIVTLKFNPTEEQPYAVEVWTKFGVIGYLAPYDVTTHIGFFKSAESPEGVIKKLTGGTLDKPDHGCILSIFLRLDEADRSDEKQPHMNLGLNQG